jgi:hypothetical protein
MFSDGHDADDPDRLGSLAQLRAMVAAREDDRNIGSQLPDLPQRSSGSVPGGSLPAPCARPSSRAQAVLPSNTPGGSPAGEFRPPGPVGPLSNECLYRDSGRPSQDGETAKVV